MATAFLDFDVISDNAFSLESQVVGSSCNYPPSKNSYV